MQLQRLMDATADGYSRIDSRIVIQPDVHAQYVWFAMGQLKQYRIVQLKVLSKADTETYADNKGIR